VTTAEEGLRDASDTLLASLDRLAELETEKRQLQPDDPRLIEVAGEVEGLAAQVLEVATVQSHLVETVHVMTMTDEPDAPSGPIDPAPRTLYEILAEWRAAERALAEAPPGSTEAADALVRARDLRAEYQRAYQEADRKRGES
jgi:hypothetical protein